MPPGQSRCRAPPRGRLHECVEVISAIPVILACICLPCLELDWIFEGSRPIFKHKRQQRPNQPHRLERPPRPEPPSVSQLCCVDERQLWRQENREKVLLSVRQKAEPRDGEPPSRSSRPLKQTTPKRSAGEQPHAAFRRILDLPPELRERIYICYIEAYNEQRLTPFRLPSPDGKPLPEQFYYKPIPPHEPPLTQVCRLLRKESLPLFYSTFRFPLIAHQDNNLCYTIVKWYRRLDREKLRAIRKLEVYFCFEMGDRGFGFMKPSAVSYHVDFDLKADSSVVSLGGQQGGRRIAAHRLYEWRYLGRHVSERTNAMMQDPGIGHFEAADFDRLVPRFPFELDEMSETSYF